jgi:hypothetical protein
MNRRGWLDRLIDEAPRMRIVLDVPMTPEFELTATLGMRDCNNWPTVWMGASFTSWGMLSDATCADCARRSWFPAVPVTTTSDRATSDWTIWKFTVAV